MIISITQKKEFIPEFNGNKDEPAGSQIRVLYKTPTADVKERLAFKPAVRQVVKEGNESEFEVNLGTDVLNTTKAARIIVDSIENLGWEDENGKKYSITTFDALLKAPVQFQPLIDEIGNHIKEALNSTVNEKN